MSNEWRLNEVQIKQSIPIMEYIHCDSTSQVKLIGIEVLYSYEYTMDTKYEGKISIMTDKLLTKREIKMAILNALNENK